MMYLYYQYENEEELEAGGCLVDGVVYANYADVPGATCRDLCFCNNGEVICSGRECAHPRGYPDCTPIPPEGEKCCPDRFECGESS